MCKNDKNKDDPQPHEQSNLMLTQIVTGDVLNVMSKKLHLVRNKLGIKCNSNSCKDGTSILNGLTNLDDSELNNNESLNSINEQQQSSQLNSTSNMSPSNNSRPHNKGKYI